MRFSRRGLMAASAAIAAAPSAFAKPKTTGAPAPWTPDATELAGRVRRKEVSAAELVEAAIARIETLQPQVQALVASDFERALEKAKSGQVSGPFAGVPFLVKDLDPYKGLPTRYGTRASIGARPDTAQTGYVDAFDGAGFVTLGKSATPEYGFLPTTEPMGFLPTRNPWNTKHSSGGSSGGAAAAVASGMVSIAHASDGGGSIRIPSANCGLFGLKPSRGRMIPNRPSSRGIDLSVSHALTHSVRDSAALFAATERTDAGAPFKPIGVVTAPLKRKLKVGLVMNGGTGLAPDPEVQAAVDNAAKLLKDLGHRVEPTAWPMDGAQFGQDFTVLWASGAAELVAGVTKAMGRKPDAGVLEPFTLGMAELVGKLPQGALPAALQRLNATIGAYDAWLSKYDVILSPVLGKPPVELGYVAGWVSFEELQARLMAYVGYTPVQNVAGAPAMSVPLHWTADGLPVGVQIAGRAGGEATLLALAYQLEEAQPWAHRRPTVSA
ncbi:amidase [Caulobacter sp.]|uniref:amidase n=1 Tax=Caulobacter sp. TaxID=78 RepID=UPI002B47DDEF|nr:amidase [Caulobacter sp.]HJV42915.1 amidase [Caulobacter sp.]